jgi:hypothetical protein
VTGPVEADQVEPLDPTAYKHQARLLKSAHCARPVVHQGLHQFINGLTLYHDGGRVAMLVYLAGIRDGIDSNDIRIKSTKHEASEENRSE